MSREAQGLRGVKTGTEGWARSYRDEIEPMGA